MAKSGHIEASIYISPISFRGLLEAYDTVALFKHDIGNHSDPYSDYVFCRVLYMSEFPHGDQTFGQELLDSTQLNSGRTAWLGLYTPPTGRSSASVFLPVPFLA